MQRDALPTSLNGSLLAKIFLGMFIVAVLLLLFRCGSGDNCDDVRATYGQASQEYRNCVASHNAGGAGFIGGMRTGGGSFGGYSSGGSHK